MRKWKIGCLVVVAVVILSPFVYFGWMYVKNLIGVHSKGKAVVRLLDENYHDKFAIAEGHYNWGNDSYQFKAYPINEPDFKFSVLISRLSESGISCSYLFMRRAHNLEKQVKKYIDAISLKNFFTASSGPDVDLKMQDEIQDFINTNRITLNELILRKYPYLLRTVTRITYCYDVTDKNKEEIAKNIYKLLCFYREKKFGVISIHIAFFKASLWNDERFRREAEHNPSLPAYSITNESIRRGPDYEAEYYLNILENSTDTDKIISYRAIENKIVHSK